MAQEPEGHSGLQGWAGGRGRAAGGPRHGSSRHGGKSERHGSGSRDHALLRSLPPCALPQASRAPTCPPAQVRSTGAPVEGAERPPPRPNRASPSAFSWPIMLCSSLRPHVLLSSARSHPQGRRGARHSRAQLQLLLSGRRPSCDDVPLLRQELLLKSRSCTASWRGHPARSFPCPCGPPGTQGHLHMPLLWPTQ